MSKRQTAIKDIVLIAMLTAVLSGGKQALAAIPNVEVVTLCIILFAYCFKPYICFTVTIIFVIIECMIWGLNTWVITYMIHWNFLSLTTFVLAQVFKIKQPWIYTVIAVALTIAFGVLSSTVDALVASDKSGISFFRLFTVIYVRGIVFYVVQTVSNFVIVSLLFYPLSQLLSRLNSKYYGNYRINNALNK